MTYEKKIVGYDASQHTKLVDSIPTENTLKFYNIFRHLNLEGKKVVDIGCGDGAVSREAINRGASHVLGIDSHPDMIKIAEKLNKGYVTKIDYENKFIEDIKGDESYDVAILSYLLNNAQNPDQLTAQCKGTASFLKKGGITVVYNNNPFDKTGGDFSKYGFIKTMNKDEDGNYIEVKNGGKIIYDYRPTIKDYIINYYLSPKIHLNAFRKADFSKFKWERLKLMENADNDYWHEYFNRDHLPVIGMLAEK